MCDHNIASKITDNRYCGQKFQIFAINFVCIALVFQVTRCFSIKYIQYNGMYVIHYFNIYIMYVNNIQNKQDCIYYIGTFIFCAYCCDWWFMYIQVCISFLILYGVIWVCYPNSLQMQLNVVLCLKLCVLYLHILSDITEIYMFCIKLLSVWNESFMICHELFEFTLMIQYQIVNDNKLWLSWIYTNNFSVITTQILITLAMTFNIIDNWHC